MEFYMIDLAQLRNNEHNIVARIEKKDPRFNIQALLDADKAFRAISTEVDALREEKNKLASQAKQQVTDEIRSRSIEISKILKQKEQELALAEAEFKNLYASCPNPAEEDVPTGNKEANVVVREIGAKPTFDFEPQSHVELGNNLGWFDFEAAARMTGSNFALYKGDAVKLLYSLTMLMLKNNIKHGFTPILPPYLVNTKSLEAAGQLPKFADGVYKVENEDLYLSPTSEVNLTNMYRDMILDRAQLPVRMTAWTSCFRREAGGYGSAERGLIRIHEFEKLELYSIVTPEESAKELEKMVAAAENILQMLGLHYRVSLLAAQDTSFQSVKTYDIEVWMPGQKAYYEVSSASNCHAFQARRGGIRYREFKGGKTVHAHTLNASSLALPRLMVALMETYQQADGSIELPAVIKEQGLFE
ncbi:serine--tRNA ligase [Candidatus Chromulinivorax destructor]|uniref:Serine--tRNA ligase n=2 Tax=Candidatus Chromulinivorax destructor TaxID=2066483 RepID=A0A345ZAU7_9BACT|nr:serine--tRNA ligase [Candidatus Chromulinivorax destructor]